MTPTLHRLAAHLEEARVLAILRRPDIGAQVLAIADKLFQAGVRAVEITQDQTDSLVALQRLTAQAPAGLLVGAGTVMTIDQLDAVAGAGGRFAVCPHLDPELVHHGETRGVPVIPGVATPTEVAMARAAGAQILKLFPAAPLGTEYLKALRGPFPDLAVIPTGGIQPGDVPAWLDAGAVCVGVGSGLFRGDGVDPDLTEVIASGQKVGE